MTSHDSSMLLPEVPNERLPSWRHQRAAFWAAYGRPASMLEMGMGTGKTKVACDLAREWGARRILIICPNSVRPVWPKEWAVHGPPANVVVLDRGTTADKNAVVRRALAPVDGPPVVVVAGYDSAWRDPLAATLLGVQWDMIILDESHRAKAPTGRRGKFVWKLKGKRKICLTGTPMNHSIFDAFAQYRFLDSGIFGTSYTAFKRRYAEFGGYLNYEVKRWINQDDFRQRYESICYQVGADVLDLPEAQHIEVPIVLGDRTMRHYREIENDLITQVGEGVLTADNALVKLLRLHQLTSGYLPLMGDDGSAQHVEVGREKADALYDILESLPDDEKVVVFCLFRADLDAVADVCQRLGRRAGELSGRRNDLSATATFPDGVDVMAVQMQSGGVGIDLTAASRAIYYSVGFNAGDYTQSLARVHRPGQTRPVFYHHLVATGTVDVDIYRANAAKADAVEAILKRLGTRA